MKSAFYALCLLFSLPNLLAGFAFAVLQRTFRTRNLFLITFDFVQPVVWGVPVAAAVLLVLLVAGFFCRTRPYAAFCALALNMGALTLVLLRMGPPTDLDEGVFCLPVFIALIGFALIAYHDLKRGSRAASFGG